MKARQIIEKFTGPSQEEVDAILRIIDQSRTWTSANTQLEPYRIKFTEEHRDLNRTGAIGGCEGDWIFLNARYFWNSLEQWRTVIEHEMTHREQLARAAARGAPDVSDRKMARLMRGGKLNVAAYLRDPLELQALARNAVSSARQKGMDPKALMKAGRLALHAPLQPGNLNRFHKYAYQMAEALLS